MKRLSLILSILVLLYQPAVLALSPEQRKLYQSGVRYFDIEQCQPATSSTLSGDDNIAKIFNFFVGKGLTDYQAAGIMGNMQHESSYEPRKMQNVFNDANEEDAFAKGLITKVTPGDGGLVEGADLNLDRLRGSTVGWGLVQFTPPNYMVEPTLAEGKNPSELGVQLEFIWQQLEGQGPAPQKAAGDALKAAANVAEATLAFEVKYERHAGDPQPERIVEAERILELAKSGGISTTDTATSSGGSKNVYILGDSITVGAAQQYTEKFPSNGITPTISAVGGRSWTTPGSPDIGAVGTTGTGRDALQQDAASVKAAGGIVIALGTNGLLSGNPIDEVIRAVKDINPDAPIWWVNVASGPVGSQGVVDFNNALKEKQAAGEINVVDWAQVADPGGNGTNNSAGLLGGDGIHPNTDGTSRLTDLVVSAVGQGIGNSKATNGCGETTSSAGGGNAIATALEYAWPDYRGKPYTEQKPEYKAAIDKAIAEGRYVGGNRGNDCGGFVTTVMIDSGFEPGYNNGGKGGNTYIQEDWTKANWQLLPTVTDSSQLSPGDVAFYDGHTFLYVGKQDGFETEVASASVGSAGGVRSPMAGMEDLFTDPSGNPLRWYRKK